MNRVLLVSSLLLVACDSGSRSKADPDDEPAGPPGAASLEELRERAVAALRAGDGAAYLQLMASPAYLMKHCSEEPDYAALEEGGEVAARAQQKLKVNNAVAECADAFDWAGATLDRVSGGEVKPSSSLRCSPAAAEHEDLMTFYRVGSKTWRVKAANDPYRIAGRYVVLDVPACEQRDR